MSNTYEQPALLEALQQSVGDMPWPVWVATPEQATDDYPETVNIWTNDALSALVKAGEASRVMADLRDLSRVPAGVHQLTTLLTINDTRYRPMLKRTQTPDGRWACVGWLVASSSAQPSPNAAEIVETLTHRPLVFDQRTGLTVRGTTERELRSEISRSRRYGNPLSVLVAEVGATEDVSEAARAEALITLARTLKDNLRWVDILGAWDAETVVVILPETNYGAAGQLLEKLRAPFEGVSRFCQGFEVHAGVGQWTQGDLPESLVARARGDAALMEPAATAN